MFSYGEKVQSRYTFLMKSQRLRPLYIAASAILVIWAVAGGGYWIARSMKMTAEKVMRYTQSVDLSKLSGDERHRAILRLAAMLNAVPRDERRHAHWGDVWHSWFKEMTESEKEEFISATLPTDIKQMLDAFEKMTPEKRKKTVDEAIRNMRKDEDQQASRSDNSSTNNANTNKVVAQLSPEAEQRMQTLGLRTFYSESSAESKAELAPLLEEIQHQMESGRAFR